MFFSTTRGMRNLLISHINRKQFCHTRYRKKPLHGSRYLVDSSRTFEFNAWDDVQWDAAQEAEAKKKVSANGEVKLSFEEAQKFEKDSNKYWDSFYDVHSNRFFKDRHWLFTEFPELNFADKDRLPGGGNKTILEIGCGVGNTIFPIVQYSKNKNVFVYGCDFSERAVQIFKENPEYDADRCNVFVLDATSERWDVPFEEGSLDIVVLIFVLSSIRPEKIERVVRQVFNHLKPGGLVLFRDYGRYDLAQLRFKAGQCLEDNFYVRGDGTRVYFFTEDEVREMFEGAGLVKEEVHVDRRLQVNRGRMLKMYRVWIQAKYRKPL